MSVEFIGYISSQESSEIDPPTGPVFDVAHVGKVARVHEDSGFDRALVPFHSMSSESLLVAAHAASVAKRLNFMIAHRPGLTAPTLAARQFATLDQFTGGRVAVHIVTGGGDTEMRQDGDFLTKDERYERTDEYLEILRRVWNSEEPFDHSGKYYRFEQAFSDVQSVQQPHIPIYIGGASDGAITAAGRHADVFALWGQTHAQVREITARVRDAAARSGRTIRFSLAFRPILAETEEKAWARADEILARIKRVLHDAGWEDPSSPPDAGAQRLLKAAAQGTRLDRRLWTAAAAALGGRCALSLVGTPEQVANALADYYDLGVTSFLIRGFDPLKDAAEFGRTLIPATRELIAGRRLPVGEAA